jgi:hypothetical protein
VRTPSSIAIEYDSMLIEPTVSARARTRVYFFGCLAAAVSAICLMRMSR